VKSIQLIVYKSFWILIIALLFVHGSNAFTYTCEELIAKSELASKAKLERLLKMRWGKRLLGIPELITLARKVTFEIPRESTEMTVDMQDAVLLARAALEAGNMIAYRTILRTIKVKDSTQVGERKPAARTLRQLFGSELSRLFEIQPHLIHHWGVLKQLGKWQIGFPGRKDGAWRALKETPIGLMVVAINPHGGKGSVTINLKFKVGVKFIGQVDQILLRSLETTERLLDYLILLKHNETIQAPDNKYGGYVLFLPEFIGALGYPEDPLVFAITFQKDLLQEGSEGD